MKIIITEHYCILWNTRHHYKAFYTSWPADGAISLVAIRRPTTRWCQNTEFF